MAPAECGDGTPEVLTVDPNDNRMQIPKEPNASKGRKRGMLRRWYAVNVRCARSVQTRPKSTGLLGTFHYQQSAILALSSDQIPRGSTTDQLILLRPSNGGIDNKEKEVCE